MVTFGPGRESGIISLRPVITSLHTQFFLGYTAALAIPTKPADPPRKRLVVWYGMVDVCDGYLAAEASGITAFVFVTSQASVACISLNTVWLGVLGTPVVNALNFEL